MRHSNGTKVQLKGDATKTAYVVESSVKKGKGYSHRLRGVKDQVYGGTQLVPVKK